VRTLIRLLFWLVVGTGAVLAALVALLYLVDVDVFRDRIEQQLSLAFGREVVLQGPLILEPSLTPRITVNGLKIANPDWASRPFLATVDKFDIRASLLPLLQGQLQVVFLEFHGVDLLLEKTPEGINNFTFIDVGDLAVLPSIERMTLYDATIAYKGPDRALKRLHMAEATARKVPGEPVELTARMAVNAVPVMVTLRGEPQDARILKGPWQIDVLGKAGDLSLRVAGNIANPLDWRHGEYRLDLKGRHLKDLETLSGYPLPATEPVELGANIRFNLDEYVELDELSGHFGTSDLEGSLRWDMHAPRSAIRMRLESRHLYAGDMGIDALLTRNDDLSRPGSGGEPLDIGGLGAIDLDVGILVHQLSGLEKTLRDIVLTTHADQQQLSLTLDNAAVDDTHISGHMTLPWGEHLTRPASGTTGLDTLLQHVSLEVHAQAPDAIYRYATSLAGNTNELRFSSVEITAQPGAALTLRGMAALNDRPVTVRLQGESLAALAQRPAGPWRDLALEVRGDDIRLDATGSVAHPLQARGFDIRYALSGPDIGRLLPLRGAWSLAGHYADPPNRHVFDELKARIGRSDINGRIVLHQGGPRPELVARLDSGRMHIDQILPGERADATAATGLDQPLDIAALAALDLDIEARVRRLEGVAKPVKNILLSVHASEQNLTLAPARATIDGVQLDARAQLPWGRRLAAPGKDGVSIQRLLEQTGLALQAQAPKGTLHHRTVIMNHPAEVELTGFVASATPGGTLQVSARARLDDKPVRFSLQAEPLGRLLLRPKGPWQDLAVKIQLGDIQFKASGSVAHPFEARGFDIRYALHGPDIEALLPQFNLVPPLERAYSVTGHFTDLSDRVVFDELEITSGRSDIGGIITVYQDEQRPRVVAKLDAGQIYLSELPPVGMPEAAAETGHRVIPDFDLPLAQLHEFDGELDFRGKRLRTTAGDLGDISFRAILKDNVLRVDPFRVRGWAGALIESDATIDAAQDPPEIAWQWTARELDYGLLLKQAGFAETVAGTLDITLRLAGKGRTLHEILGDANGQLIIVGQGGRFGSRRLDLWGSDLVTTMLSPSWHREDVTDLNCLVARVDIEDGVASSDSLLVDTRRITIGAAGTLDFKNENLNLVFAPRPKRISLVSLTNPVRVTGTLVAPEVAVTMLPRNRTAAAGAGVLSGLVNPGYLLFTFTQTGSRQANPCVAAIEKAMLMKGRPDEPKGLPSVASPPRFSLLPGCTRTVPRRVQ
jgi:uncharacterized protein involved in outer membrane biogenesis